MSTKNKGWQIFKALSFLALGIFLIFYFWNSLSADEQKAIFSNFSNTHLVGIILPLIAGILSHLLRAMRWNMLMNAIGLRVRVSESFWAVMAGYLFNLVIPRLGEIMRCVFLSRKKKLPIDNILGTMLSERLFDLLWYVLLFFVSLIFVMGTVHDYVAHYGSMLLQSMQAKWWQWVLVLLALTFLGWTSLLYLKRRKKTWWERIHIFLKNTLKGLSAIFKLKRFYLFLFYSLLIWIMYWAMIYLAYFSLPSTAKLSAESALVVLVFATLGIMVIQGGIGIYPIIVAEILQLYGLSRVDGYSLGWITWTVQTLLVVVLGLVSLFYFSISKSYEQARKNISEN